MRSCGICACPLGGEGIETCGSCGLAHHGDCWSFNGGCSVYGCPESPSTRVALRAGSSASRWSLRISHVVACLATLFLFAVIGRGVRMGLIHHGEQGSSTGEEAWLDVALVDLQGRTIQLREWLEDRPAVLTVLSPTPTRVINDGRKVAELARILRERSASRHVTIIPYAQREETSRLVKALSLEGEVLTDPRAREAARLGAWGTTTLVIDAHGKVRYRGSPEVEPVLEALQGL